MKVLFGSTDVGAARRLRTHLDHGHHELAVELDPERLERTATEIGADVVVVDWAWAGRRAAALVTGLRSIRAEDGAWLVAWFAEPRGAGMKAAWRAGVDDILLDSAVREEVIGRCEGGLRVRHRAAPRPRVDFAATLDLSRLSAWRDLPEVAAAEVSAMIGTELRPRRAAVGACPEHVAEIAISSPSDHLEVRLTVGLSATAGRLIAGRMFGGDASDDVLGDLTREVANTVAGAFKRAGLAEGTLFTVGLPVDRPGCFADPTTEGIFLSGGSIDLFLHVRSLTRPTRRLPARLLKQGMVLAHDVRGVNGVTLLTSGATLTVHTVVRLVQLVGPEAILEVGDPSAGDVEVPYAMAG